jgi:hypothetical protein
MRHSPAEFRTAVVSGEPDRVNAAIEDVKDAETAECAFLFVNWLDEFATCFDVDDGYQRLSVIRFLRELYTPHLPVRYRDAFWNLLLKALVDEDGRVRTAALKAVDKLIIFSDYRGQPVAPLRADLTELIDTQVPTYSELQSALDTADTYTQEPPQ